MSRARILACVAGFALLAIATLRWLEREDAAVEAARPAASERAPTHLAAPRRDTTAPRTETPTSSAEATRASVDRAGAPLAPRGRLTLVGLDGAERTDVDGWITATQWCDGFQRPTLIEVVDGAWSVRGGDAPKTVALAFEDFRENARLALIEAPAGPLEAPFEQGIELRARCVARPSLRVVARNTGLDLAAIQLVTPPTSWGDEDHPGVGFESRILARDLRSPIALDAIELPLTPESTPECFAVLVGAPGFAWKRVELDLRAGGERVVELERGADLTLTVHGCDPAAHAMLMLRSHSDFRKPCIALPLKQDGRFSFTGLPIGTLRVAAENGNYDRPRVFGMLALELRAGRGIEATLDLRSVPDPRAQCSGVVHVPECWGAEEPSMDLMALDEHDGARAEMSFVRAFSRVPSRHTGCIAFAWGPLELPFGSYQVQLPELQYVGRLDVPPGGRGDLELLVPAPAELRVWILDDRTGAPLESANLDWRQPQEIRLDSRCGGPLDRAMPRSVRAPAVQIELTVNALGYLPYHERLELAPGSQELTIRLRRECGFTLALREGTTPVAIPPAWHVGIVARTDARRLTVDPGELQLAYSAEPGRYILLIPPLAGYAPVPNQIVDVEPGRTTEHVIALERKD